jgi:hypothetical protein
MKHILILLALLIFFHSSDLSAQNSSEPKIKSEGLVFNAFLGFNRSASGAIENPNSGGRHRFSRELNNNSGRFIIDTYFLANYFIIPQHLSIGLGAGVSKSYKPNFVQIPLIADLRGYIFQKSDALMLFIQYSHSPFINSNIVKGYAIEFGVGYQFKLFQNVLSLEAGIKGRRVSFVNEEILSSSHNARLNGFNIKIGYQF